MIFRSVGDAISRIRKNRGIEDLDLAKEAGIKVKILRDIESGIPPTEEQLEALSEALSVSPEGLRLAAGNPPSEVKEAMVNDPDKILDIIKDEFDIDPSDEEEQNTELEPVHSTSNGELYQGNCIDILPHIDRKFDVIFADPPFNLDKDYGEGIGDDLSEEEYLDWSTKWIDKCIPKLKDGGAFYLFNLPEWNIHLAHYLSGKLHFKHWIAVDIRNGLPIPNRLYPAHYSLLYFIKGPKPRHFTPPRLPVDTCKHCGGEQHDYGGYKSEMNPKGVNLSDVWDDIPPVRHTRYKNRDANELSVKLINRVLDTSTDQGDTVLDPFGGSGTTYAAAEIMDREWVGIELASCDPIIDRLNDLEEDRKLIEQIESEQNVLFTSDDLKKRAKYKSIFGFNFEDYNLEESMTEEVKEITGKLQFG